MYSRPATIGGMYGVAITRSSESLMMFECSSASILAASSGSSSASMSSSQPSGTGKSSESEIWTSRLFAGSGSLLFIISELCATSDLIGSSQFSISLVFMLLLLIIKSTPRFTSCCQLTLLMSTGSTACVIMHLLAASSLSRFDILMFIS